MLALLIFQIQLASLAKFKGSCTNFGVVNKWVFWQHLKDYAYSVGHLIQKLFFPNLITQLWKSFESNEKVYACDSPYCAK